MSDNVLVILTAVFMTAAVLLATTPLTRSGYIWRFLLIPSVAMAMTSLLVYLLPSIVRDYDILKLLWLVAHSVFMCQNARRFIDLGWSKWWFVVCPTGVGWIGVMFVPMIYKKKATEGKT